MMKTLNISEAEAKELIEADREIDRGAKLFELPDELKAGAKKARRAERKKPEHINRERKVDTDKLEILQACDDALCDLVDNVCKRKTETELHFEYNGAHYTLKLIRHRPPK